MANPDAGIDKRKARGILNVRKRLRKRMSEVVSREHTLTIGEACRLKNEFLSVIDGSPYYRVETVVGIREAIGNYCNGIEASVRTDGELAPEAPEAPEPETREVGGRTMVCASPSIQKVMEIVKVLAERDLSVLIQGETGTGKELVAQALHAWSSERMGEAFVAINCAAISPELLESELFGHKKGAFTGAGAAHKGLFQTVGSGTIFLDEVGDMEPRLQAKLLRALQERKFRPVGDTKEYPFNGRVISATNRDLLKRIEDGLFRSDLYYRLAEFELVIPPLRERQEDLKVLIGRLLAEINLNAKITEAAIAKLMAHPFHGNVRELEAILTRAEVMATLHNGADAVTIEDSDIGQRDSNAPESAHPPMEVSLFSVNPKIKDLLLELRGLESYQEVTFQHWKVIDLMVYWFLRRHNQTLKNLQQELELGYSINPILSGDRRPPPQVKKVLDWILRNIEKTEQGW